MPSNIPGNIIAGLGNEFGNRGANLTEINSGQYQSTDLHGVYFNSKDNTYLRVSTQNVVGATFFSKDVFKGNNEFLNALNRLGNVGQFTYIEKLDVDGKPLEASHFQSDSNGKIIRSEIIKPAQTTMTAVVGQEKSENTRVDTTVSVDAQHLSDQKLLEFRDKTKAGIKQAKTYNENSAALMAAGLLLAVASAGWGFATAAGTALGTAALNAIRIIGGPFRALLKQLPKLFKTMPNLFTKLKEFIPGSQYISQSKFLQFIGRALNWGSWGATLSDIFQQLSPGRFLRRFRNGGIGSQRQSRPVRTAPYQYRPT
jgi:hypothetical protein